MSLYKFTIQTFMHGMQHQIGQVII